MFDKSCTHVEQDIGFWDSEWKLKFRWFGLWVYYNIYRKEMATLKWVTLEDKVFPNNHWLKNHVVHDYQGICLTMVKNNNYYIIKKQITKKGYENKRLTLISI